MDALATMQHVRSGSAVPHWKLVAVFYLIACGFSWLVWLPLVLGPEGLKVLRMQVSFPVFVCIGTLGPLLASFIVHRWNTGNWRAVHFLPSRQSQWIWLAIGPLLIVFSRVFVFSALSTEGGPGPAEGLLLALSFLLVASVLVAFTRGRLFYQRTR